MLTVSSGSLDGAARALPGEESLSGSHVYGDPSSDEAQGSPSGDARGDDDPSGPQGTDVGRLLEGMELPQGVVSQAAPTVRLQAGSVEQVAVDLLASYRDARDCVLASSGYLDLLGSVWGCVVHGGDWVDVCIVSASGSEGICEVHVMRLERDEALESLKEDGTSQ